MKSAKSSPRALPNQSAFNFDSPMKVPDVVETSGDLKEASSMSPRKRLADVFNHNDREVLRQAWDQTQAAGEFGVIPPGEYRCALTSGELTASQSGTPGYKMTFRVLDGENANRVVWHDIWLTGPALAMAKRDLGKLGVESLEQLEHPLPKGFVCRVRVVIDRDDKGAERNKVRGFQVVEIQQQGDDPFAPRSKGESGRETTEL